MGPSVRVIFVGELQSKLLACIPGSAWHRKAAHRSIPTKFFQKPSKVSVAACSESDRKEVDDSTTLPVWLGFLSSEMALLVETSTLLDEVEVDFADGRLPHAEALQQLAQDHFSFFSANENGPLETGAKESGSQDLSQRMSQIELVMEQIQETLVALKSPPPRVSFVDPLPKNEARPSAMKKPPPRPFQEESMAGDKMADVFPDLDPGVVSAAIQAGVPQASLAEMQMLMGKNVKGARALRQERPSKIFFSPFRERRGSSRRWFAKFDNRRPHDRCGFKADGDHEPSHSGQSKERQEQVGPGFGRSCEFLCRVFYVNGHQGSRP